MTFLVKCTCNTNSSKMPVTWINTFLQPLDKDVEVFCIVCHALIQAFKLQLKNLVSVVQEVFSEKQAPQMVSALYWAWIYALKILFHWLNCLQSKTFYRMLIIFSICFWVNVNSLRTAVYWSLSHDLCSSWAEQIWIWLVLSVFVWLGLSEVIR